MIILLGVAFVTSGVFIFFQTPSSLHHEYVDVINKNNITGTILTSHPILYSYVDNKIKMLQGLLEFDKIYENEKGTYQAVVIDTCDLICKPGDKVCLGKKLSFLKKVEKENKRLYYAKTMDFRKITCEHLIYLIK